MNPTEKVKMMMIVLTVVLVIKLTSPCLVIGYPVNFTNKENHEETLELTLKLTTESQSENVFRKCAKDSNLIKVEEDQLCTDPGFNFFETIKPHVTGRNQGYIESQHFLDL